MSNKAYDVPCAPATWIVRPATSTLNCGVTAVTARPIPKQFLQELDDFGFELLLDFALLLDLALLEDFTELLLGVTLEDDFALLDDFTELLLDFALLELDCGVTLEEDSGSLEELELYLPKYTIMVVSLST